MRNSHEWVIGAFYEIATKLALYRLSIKRNKQWELDKNNVK